MTDENIQNLLGGFATETLTDREEQEPDFVIRRSDGQAVFHLTNVVDDLEMGVTHAIRGEDLPGRVEQRGATIHTLPRQRHIHPILSILEIASSDILT